MTKNILLTLTFLLTSTLICIAQNPNKQKVSFKYDQLPKYKIADDGKYNRVVLITYIEEIEAEKAAIELANKEAKEKAAQDKKEWDELDAGTKLLKKKVLGEAKPTGRAKVEKFPYFPNIYDHSAIENEVIKIPGMTADKNAEAKVVLSINRFTYDHREQSSTRENKTTYHFTVNGEIPVYIEVFDAEGNSVANESFLIKNTTNKDYMSSKFTSETSRSKYWESNYKTILSKIERDEMKAVLKLVKKYITENLGYNSILRKTALYSISEKKHKYGEINMLMPDLIEAYSLMQTEPENSSKVIENAVTIWEKEIEELEMGNKKARISEKVAKALYINTIESKIWLKDYMGAMKSCAKYRIIDPKGKGKEFKELELLMEDEKMRFEANQ